MSGKFAGKNWTDFDRAEGCKRTGRAQFRRGLAGVVKPGSFIRVHVLLEGSASLCLTINLHTCRMLAAGETSRFHLRQTESRQASISTIGAERFPLHYACLSRARM
jgi:hypothetical protein